MKGKEKLTLSNNRKVNLSGIIMVSFALILVMGVLGFGGSARAADYYVDYESGNDSNNGLSVSTPWKHCPGDSAATGNADITLLAGDIVIFKGGVVYTGTGSDTLITVNDSGSLGNHITYRGNTEAGDWGSGKAEIDLNADYYHAFLASSKNYINVINFDIYDTKNSFDGQDADVSFIQPPYDNHTYIRDTSYDFNGNGLVSSKGSIRGANCQHWLIQDCYFHESENWTAGCAVGQDGSMRGESGAIVFRTGSGTDLEVDNCEFWATGRTTIELANISNVNIHDCNFGGSAAVAGTKQGYFNSAIRMTTGSTYINIYDNIFHDGWQYEDDDNSIKRCHSGDWVHIYGTITPHDITIGRNFFYCGRSFNYTHGTAAIYSETGGSSINPYNITVRNNVIINMHMPYTIKMKDATNVYVNNNTIAVHSRVVDTGDGSNLVGIGLSNSGDYHIKNNIFYKQSRGGCCIKLNRSAWSGFESDNNIMYSPNDSTYMDNNGSVVSLSGWQSATGEDSNSHYGDPLLVSFPSTGASSGSGDYRLTADSADAIDGGVTLSEFSNDRDGNPRPVGSAWDIGAYEYIESGPDTTPPSRSNPSPTGELPSGTTNTAISLTTNESATCKYSTNPNTAYDSMTETFTTTGSTSHSTTVDGLSDGNSYTYCVRCRDSSGNANTDDYVISFSVATQGVGDSGDDGGGESSGGGCFIGTAAMGQ